MTSLKTTISVRNFDGDVRRRVVPTDPKARHLALVKLCNQGWDEYREGTSGWRRLPSSVWSFLLDEIEKGST